MRAVRREEFLPSNLREFAYEDSPLPIASGQTILAALVCTENLIRRNPCSCAKIPCSSDGERIICPALGTRYPTAA